MRWVAVLLVVVNLALWLYLMNRPAPGVGDDAGGRLPRVAELEVLGGPSRELAGEAGGGPLPGTAAVAAPKLVQGVSERAAAGSGLDGVSAGDVDVSVSVPPAVDEPSSPVPDVVLQPADYCLELGWFDDENSALGALGQIDVAGVVEALAVEQRSRELAPLHWVIIPPLPNRQEALALFRSIQRRGVDSYLVTEGEQENAISLGLFESRAAAEGVLAKRNSENLNAVLAFFPRNQISYALVFRAVYVPESKEQSQDLAEFKRRFEMVKISRCEGVATAEKNP